MNTQYKAQDVQAIITEAGFDWDLSKSGRKWELDGNTFDNLKQVVSYVEAEKQRVNPTGTVMPELNKQGCDAIKFDTTKLVVFNSEIRSPRPSKIKDPEASVQLETVLGSDAYDAVTDMLRDEQGKVYPELKEVTNIRNGWNNFVDKYALKFHFKGGRVVSIHHRDLFEAEIIEVNDKLSKVKNAIVAKLDDWKQVAQAKGNYVAEKFPSAHYFEGYGIVHFFSQIDDSFSFKDEIASSAVEKIRNDVTAAIKSISDYLSGDKSKFRENKITNIAESVGVLKESGMIADDTFNNLLNRIEEATTAINTAAIREAKSKVDKGVVVPPTSGRGRKPVAITATEIEQCQDYIDTALDPLKELAQELEGLV
jgi:hypothetical protein